MEYRKHGMTQKEVSVLCGMGAMTIGKIDRLYEQGGWKAVVVVKLGRHKDQGTC